MSKIIDITNKLNFEEKPVIKVKDVEVEANNDAVTMLKVVALFGENGEGVAVNDILTVYNLLFDEENRKKIESLKLSFEDFTTLIMESAQTLMNNGEEPDEGETATPAMT
ncbi:MAG: hypothetical protein J1E85_09415 [Ruminococcus sp.]|nr:hypothetical protein [Ruminococcus sp.]